MLLSFMITSPHNGAQDDPQAPMTGAGASGSTCSCEGEDLVGRRDRRRWEPELLLRAGREVERELLDEVSTLGSGTRVIGVYPRRWSEPGGRLMTYLHGVDDPGNVGTIIRSARTGRRTRAARPRVPDPFSPKAVRASMGSVFARPPGRGEAASLDGTLVALDPRDGIELAAVRLERSRLPGRRARGLPAELPERASIRAPDPLRDDGPESLNIGPWPRPWLCTGSDGRPCLSAQTWRSSGARLRTRSAPPARPPTSRTCGSATSGASPP